MDFSEKGTQEFKARGPDHALIWTKLWTGWYDTWGYERHVRDPRNLTYYFLRFITASGTAWNYYMWHAGTNFGRTAMFFQSTASRRRTNSSTLTAKRTIVAIRMTSS